MSALSGPLALMPECATECLASALASSTCSPTDEACTCSDKQLTRSAMACITGACTSPEVLTATNASYANCGVEPRVHGGLVAPLIIFIILTTIVVAMRFLTRILVGMKLWWDDWFNFIAMLATAAYTVYTIVLKGQGFGTDIWALTPDNITNLLRGAYILAMLYVIARLFIRISIVLFYLRIFQADVAKRFMKISLVVTILISVPLVLAAVFMCTPIPYFWQRWDGLHSGHCINSEVYIWTGWIILLVNDFWLMAVPLPFVAKLQLSLCKKILVTIMFCTGLFVVALSIYKLTLIEGYLKHDNPSYNQVPMAVWAAIELDIGVICACLPSMPVLFRPVVSRLRGTHRSSNSSAFTGSGSRYGEINSSRTLSKKNKNKLFSTNSSSSFTGTHSDIYMTTTIHQTNRGSESETELAVRDVEAMHNLVGPHHSNFKVQAWS